MRVTATEFQKNFGRFQDTALQEPVTITKNRRPHTVLISAELYELMLSGRTAQKVESLDAETLDAIGEAEVPAEHAHLDELISKR